MKSAGLKNSLFVTALLFAAASSWAANFGTTITFINNSQKTYSVSVSGYNGGCGGVNSLVPGQKLSQPCTDNQTPDTYIAQVNGYSGTTATECWASVNTSQPVEVIITNSGSTVSCTLQNDSTLGYVTPIIIDTGVHSYKSSEFIYQNNALIGVNHWVPVSTGTHYLPAIQLSSNAPLQVVEKVYSTAGVFLAQCSGPLDPVKGYYYVDIGLYESGSTVSCKIW